MNRQTGKHTTKHEHLFAVLRIDLPVDAEAPEDAVVVTKVYGTEDAADVEADRVNALNSDRGSRYFVRVGRFVKD